MGTTKVACALFGTAFSSLVLMAVLGTACGGKSHVEGNNLGDDAATGPTGTCSSCGFNSVCIMNQCATPWQNDHECGTEPRCLHTTQGGGGIPSAQTHC